MELLKGDPVDAVLEACLAMAEASPLPMVEIDVGTHGIRYVNAAFCLLSAETEEDLLGKVFTTLTSAGGEKAQRVLERVDRTGRAETYIPENPATSHPLSWSYAVWPVLAPDRSQLGLMIQVNESVSIQKDAVLLNQALMVSSIRQQELTEEAETLSSRLRTEIAAHIAAENALRESEMRFRALVTASSDVIYRMGPDWGEMRHLQGRRFLPDTEHPNRTWLTQYIPLTQQVPVLAAIQEAIRTKSMFALEHQVVRVDGSPGWTFSRAVPLLDDKGEIAEWFGTATDVTERKQAEEKIRLYAERARFVMDSMPQKIFTTSATGTGEYFNKQWTEFTGKSAEQIKSWRWTQFLHPDDAEETERFWRRSIESGEPFHLEHRFRREDGCDRWHLTRALPFRDGGGNVSMWIGSSTDIQDQKLATVALLKTEKLAAVGRLAASIAHEINNPLDAVMNTVYLAQGEPNLTEAAREYLRIADAELRRIAHITRQTLGFYRESSGPTTFAATTLLASVTDVLLAKVSAKRVSVQSECDPDLEIAGIFGELRQVLSNLVLNSVDAVGFGGVVRLRASSVRRGTAVRFTIADNGSGIAPAVMSQLFEPFFTTKGAVGTGLGLYVSKQLIESHGGSVRVRSSLKDQHRGTVFCIVLPRRQHAE